ncbi:MAG TPA: signal peptidase I [Xanthobacteraceae bacterium]|nr:signal peptidase I [Xanthobacteraceae bacterium]
MQRPIAMSTPNLAPRRKLSGVVQFAVIFGLVLLAKVVAAEAFYVPSGSMQPTLLIGDELVVSKFAYGYSRYSLPIALGPSLPERLLGRVPERGDVVVFRLPRDPSQTYVKRVVGLPGDRVQMRNGRLWINGKILPLRRDGFGNVEAEDGSIVRADRYIETLPGGREHPLFKLIGRGDLDDTDVIKVTPGHVFVMGDNRDDSADSRLSPVAGGVGLVPVENLVGRVEAVLGSWDLATARHPIWTWPSGLRLRRFFSRVD